MFRPSVRILCIIAALLLALTALPVCAESENATEIKYVRADKEGTLSVHCTLSDGMLDDLKGKPVYLFAFYPGDKNADVERRAPVDFVMAQSSFTFTLDLDADPMLKYGKYIMAYQDEEDYVLFGNVKYLENPEVLSEVKKDIPETDSIIGVEAEGDECSDKLPHRVVSVYLNTLFADTADGSLRYEYGDSVYYIDTEVLSRLDGTIEYFAGEGKAVYLQLLLGESDESTAKLTMSLYAQGAKGSLYAPNTEDERGARLWACLIEFLAHRYAIDGTVNAFILGDNVNIADNYALGTDKPEQYLRSLSCTLRLTETAVRSACDGVDVYLSLDGAFAGSHEGVYPIRDILVDICQSDMGFGIYLDISCAESAFWTDESVRQDSATPRITPKNLDFFLSYMSVDQHLYESRMRPLMLGYHTDGIDRRSQAASTLSALYRAMSLEGVNAFIYNDYMDTEGTSGLLGVDGLPKDVYSQLCAAADGDIVSIGDQIRELMRADEFESLRDSVLSDLFIVRGPLPVYNGELAADVDAMYLADFVDAGVNSFNFGRQTITYGSTMDSTGKVLRLTARTDTASMSRVYEKGYDLNDKNVLVVELKALAKEAGADFTLVLDGIKDGAGVSLTATVHLNSGEWNECAFDVSGIDTLTGMSLIVRSSDGGELSWYIKDITVFATGMGMAEMAMRIAVGVLVAVIVLFVILLLILIRMRFKKRVTASRYYTVRRKVSEVPPVEPKQEKSESEIPVMPKTEPKTFVVPPKHIEPVKRDTLSVGIDPAGTETEIDKTKGEEQ